MIGNVCGTVLPLPKAKTDLLPPITFMFKYPNARKPESQPASSPFANAGIPDEWASPLSNPAPDTAEQGGYEAPASEPSPFASDAVTPSVSSRNVLNSDVTVVGTLRFTDDLLVDGSVEGEITSDGVLTVGANAVITAGEGNKVAVNTKSAIIHGRVTGDVVVTDRVELASTAQLVGDVTASKIAIQEGATFIGYCRVGVSATTPLPVSAPKKAGSASSKKTDTNLLV